MESTSRIIKKYSNRRLYDTAISSYITLQDVRKLVLEHVAIKIIDAESSEDLTCDVLLQIITELESKDSPIFTRLLLENMIRLYGHPMQSVMSQYLEKSLLFMLEQQHDLKNQFDHLLHASNPVQFWGEIAQMQMQWWQNMQQSFWQPTPSANKKETPHPPAVPSSE